MSTTPDSSNRPPKADIPRETASVEPGKADITVTARCVYNLAYARDEIGHGDSLEAALEDAIRRANENPVWESTYPGETFIETFGHGEDADLDHAAVPVPSKFSEEATFGFAVEKADQLFEIVQVVADHAHWRDVREVGVHFPRLQQAFKDAKALADEYQARTAKEPRPAP